MDESSLVIMASARAENSNTKKAVDALLGEGLPCVTLCTLNISPYDYKYRNKDDDFLPLAQKLVTKNPIVFATPVYWYTMSAHMKIFLDRLTDLLMHHRLLKKQLQGKTVALVTASAGGRPAEFTLPFERTLEYMSMNYGGCWDMVFPDEKWHAHNEEQKAKAREEWPRILEKCKLEQSNH
jgi:multimeric flavodoxin WrbA